MDFEFTEEQTALRELARQILASEVTPERLKAAERGDAWFDAALWSSLAEANLLGLAVPEAQGGMGFGVLELCVLLEEIGRAVAPVPAYPALLLGGLPIARFGSEAQRQQWLPALAAGELVLSGALHGVDAGRLPVRAQRAEGGWRLDGVLRQVPSADLAARVLVPAATGDGAGLFLVDPRAEGATLRLGRASRGERLAELGLSGVRVEDDALLGSDAEGGARAAAWLADCARIGLCATQVGVSERALEITTAHLREREQFGAPIGSFPAVQQRAADAYIDLEAMRWTTWRAAWRVGEDLPAAREVSVAKFWSAEAGARIAASAQHLHGGLGVDMDYPIHRYFLWSKALELSLGSATPQLVRLGRDLAASGPQQEIR